MKRNRRRLSFAIAILSLAGCATPTPHTTPEQRAEIHQAYKQCVAREAEILDDGVSPANVIGDAIGDACYSQFQADSMLIVENDNEAVKRQFLLNLPTLKGDGPTHYVLSRRNALARKGRSQ